MRWTLLYTIFFFVYSPDQTNIGVYVTQRTSDRLRDALEQEILLGRLDPGVHLDEASLGARFGVSRTPIREALGQLAASGLVEVRPRRGAFVAMASIRDLVEMFEVMAELEAMCARLAARRMDRTEHRELRAAHEDCRASAADADAYYYCNERFHGVIYDACGNRFLRRQTVQLRNRLKPYRRLQLHVPHRVDASLAEHERIVEAIVRGDEIRVDSEIKEHILVQGRRFSDLMAALPADRESDAGK